MADRIIGMREELYNLLVNELGSKHDWSHIKSQIGLLFFAHPCLRKLTAESRRNVLLYRLEPRTG